MQSALPYRASCSRRSLCHGLAMGGVFSSIGRYAEAVGSYYTIFLSPNFVVAPLLVAGSIWVAFQAIRSRRAPETMLTLGLLLFVPIIVCQGIEGFRDRQGVLFFMLSYIALANALITPF